jgi:hypothetical protein
MSSGCPASAPTSTTRCPTYRRSSRTSSPCLGRSRIYWAGPARPTPSSSPVAWLDVTNPGRGEGARSQLSVVLAYVGARIVRDACVHIGVERTAGAVTIAPTERPRPARAVRDPHRRALTLSITRPEDQVAGWTAKDSQRVWMGQSLVTPQTASGSHHRGDAETAIHVVSGHPVFVFAENGREVRLTPEPGDYVYVPPVHAAPRGEPERRGSRRGSPAQQPGGDRRQPPGPLAATD